MTVCITSLEAPQDIVSVDSIPYEIIEITSPFSFNTGLPELPPYIDADIQTDLIIFPYTNLLSLTIPSDIDMASTPFGSPIT